MRPHRRAAFLGPQGFALLLGGSVAVLAWLALGNLWFEHRLLLELVAFGIVVVVGLASVRWTPLAPARDARFLGVLLALFLASRLAWVAWVPTLPVSDFAFYDSLAREVASGGPITVRWPQMGIISAWGYPVVLGGSYAVFGATLMVAKVFNVVLGALALLALYRLAREVGGSPAARSATVLFLLWPGQLFYTSVLGSEHLALPLLLVALGSLVHALDNRAGDGLGRIALTGVLLAACVATRSVLATAVIAALLMLLARDVPWPRRLGRCGVLVAAWAASLALFVFVLETCFAARPVGGGWWSLLIGMNIEHGGQWNLADVTDFVAQPDIDSANRFARAQILMRIRSDPGGAAALFFDKISTLWTDGGCTVYWSLLKITETPAVVDLTAPRDAMVVTAQTFHVVALALGALGMLAVAWRRCSNGALALLLFLFLTTLAHGLLETQPRYNLPLQPVLFVFAGIGVAAVLTRATAQPQPSLRATTSQHSIA